MSNKEGYQSGQMGRAVNPLTSVFESSNLSPSTKLNKCFIIESEKFGLCGCRIMVIPQISKLMLGVRFSSSAPNKVKNYIYKEEEKNGGQEKI